MDKLQNFIYGIGASNELLHRAFESRSFIEMVCLAANQIDALLRLAIILEHQLKNDSKVVIEDLLFQGESDKIVMEKKIYDRACEEGVINQIMRDRLYTIYNERNKVVHRYIISDITTADLEGIARDFLLVRNEIKEMVREIENRQVAVGKGMTSEGSLSQEELQTLVEKSISDKHGKIKLDIPPENGKSGTTRYYKL